MADTNGQNKWVMWAVGIMLTIGMAAQGAQLHYVNMKFQEHENRPHKGAVSKDRFNDIYNELREIRKELVKVEIELAQLRERLKNK